MLKLESANHGKMLWTTVGYFLKSEEVMSITKKLGHKKKRINDLVVTIMWSLYNN